MPLPDVRSIARRAKEAERNAGRWMLQFDGPDPMWSKVTSSTGRVGHITGLQFDVASLHYCTESKNILMSLRLQRFWRQIQEIAVTHGKDACLVIKPSNPLPSDKRHKHDATWHVITQERHSELLEKERIADAESQS